MHDAASLLLGAVLMRSFGFKHEAGTWAVCTLAALPRCEQQGKTNHGDTVTNAQQLCRCMKGERCTSNPERKRYRTEQHGSSVIGEPQPNVTVDARTKARRFKKQCGPDRFNRRQFRHMQKGKSDKKERGKQRGATDTAERCYGRDDDARRQHEPVDQPIHSSFSLRNKNGCATRPICAPAPMSTRLP